MFELLTEKSSDVDYQSINKIKFTIVYGLKLEEMLPCWCSLKTGINTIKFEIN